MPASELQVGDLLYDGLNAHLTNLFRNPTFAYDTVGDHAVGYAGFTMGTLPNSRVEPGFHPRVGKALRTTFSGEPDGSQFYYFVAFPMPVVGGKLYSFAQYGYQYEDTGGITALLQFYDATGAVTGSSVSANSVSGTGPFVSKAEAMVVPDNAVFAAGLFGMVSASAPCDYEISCFTLNPGALANQPFDGNSDGWSWTGEAGNSASHASNQIPSTVAFVQPAVAPEPAGTVRVGIDRAPNATVSVFIPADQQVRLSNR